MPPRSSAPAQLRSGPADHAARHPPHQCHPQAREGHPASRGNPGKSARLAAFTCTPDATPSTPGQPAN